MVQVLSSLVLLVSLIVSSIATAQTCDGQFPPGTACGNSGTTFGQPSPVPVTLDVAGISSLRNLPVVNGQTVHLKYHTVAGDLGAGFFVGVIGTSGPGFFKDDNGTVVVPIGGDGSNAWTRVWDKQNADLGWWGAKLDGSSDDTNALTQAIGMFSYGGTCNGSYAFTNAILNIHRGSSHSKPIVYAGCGGAGLTIRGDGQFSQGGTPSILVYTGPTTHDQITLFNASATSLENVTLIVNNALNGVHYNSDNIYCSSPELGCTGGRVTTANALSPGNNVTINFNSLMTFVAVGTQLGLGYNTPNFEVVTVNSVGSGATSVVVDTVLNTHNANETIGGGAPLNGSYARNVWVGMPDIVHSPKGAAFLIGNEANAATGQISDVNLYNVGCAGFTSSTFNGNITPGSGGTGILNITTTISGNSNGLHPGMYLGDDVFGGTFRIKRPTKLVSQNSPTQWVVDTSQTVATQYMGVVAPAHACVYSSEGGNTKNFIVDFLLYIFVEVAADFTRGSGYIDLHNVQGSQQYDAIFLMGGANYNVYNFEDESPGMVFRAGCGSNNSTINFISGSYQSAVPNAGPYAGYAGVSSCSVTMIGTQFLNGDPTSTTPAKIKGVCYGTGAAPCTMTVISCWFQYATSGTPIFFDGSNNPMDSWFDNNGGNPIYQTGTVKNMTLIALNNMGGTGGAITFLDNILPNTRNQEQSVSSSYFGQQNEPDGAHRNKAIFNKSISGAKSWASVSLPYNLWTSPGTTVDWQTFLFPAKTKITGIYLDVTQGFTSNGNATGCCTIQVGTFNQQTGVPPIGGSDIILNTSVSTIKTVGLADTDLGTNMKQANLVQGGYMIWGNNVALSVRLGVSSGNIGVGFTSTNLTQGNVDIYIQTERMTAP